MHIPFSSYEIWKSIFSVLNQDEKNQNPQHSVEEFSQDKSRRKINRIKSAEVCWVYWNLLEPAYFHNDCLISWSFDAQLIFQNKSILKKTKMTILRLLCFVIQELGRETG